MDRPLEGDLGVATRPRQSVPGSRAQQGRRLRLPEKSSSPIRSHPCLCWGCHSAADTGSDCSPTDAATPHLKPKTLVNVIGLNLKLASLRTPEKWGGGVTKTRGTTGLGLGLGRRPTLAKCAAALALRLRTDHVGG